MRASGYSRAEHGFYVEPAWLVEALVAVERPFTGRVWDPFCGTGTIPRVLSGHGVRTVATDLMAHGYGLDGLDFFTSSVDVDSIVANPPFHRLEEAVRRAVGLASDRVCMIGRLAFLEGQGRARGLFRDFPLARVHVSSRRASMPPGGSDVVASGGTIAMAWFVWERGHTGPWQGGWC